MITDPDGNPVLNLQISDKETIDNTQFIRNIAESFFIVIFVTV